MSKRWLVLVGGSIIYGLFILADYAFAVEPICPGGSNPNVNVIHCEDFDGGGLVGNPAWSVSPFCCDTNRDGIVSAAETEPVQCGSFGFETDCSFWTEEGKWDGTAYDGHYAERALLGTAQDIWIRYYYRTDSTWQAASLGQKRLIVHNPARTCGPFDDSSSFNSGRNFVTIYDNSRHQCIDQTSPNINNEFPDCTNRQPPVPPPPYNPATFEMVANRWYLVEMHYIMNAPVSPTTAGNGTFQLYVDEVTPGVAFAGSQTLRNSRTDAVFCSAGTGHVLQQVFGRIWLDGYWDGTFQGTTFSTVGNVRYDQMVVSRAAIGPMNAEPEPKLVRGNRKVIQYMSIALFLLSAAWLLHKSVPKLGVRVLGLDKLKG